MLGVGAAAPACLESDRHVPGTTGLTEAAAEAVTERESWAILSAVDGLGPVAMTALLARFGTARAVLSVASAPGSVERLADTPALEPGSGREARRPVSTGLAVAIVASAERGRALLDRLRLLDLQLVTLEDSTYPSALRRIAMPPHLLFVRGALPAIGHEPAIAVVGTRRPSPYGRRTTVRITDALVDAGASVVSGLAYGVDGVAHEAALRRHGTTVAVIGGGHATGIPAAHERLAEAIVAGGGAVVSEHAPDTAPTRGTFPRRNRVISGLARATVVVEAPARSGALITASWALEQGRGCFVVPGPIDSPASAGCLAFLRESPDAARIVAGIPQLIADLGLAVGSPEGGDAVTAAVLEPLGRTARAIAVALIRGAATVDELVAVTDLPVATVLAAIGLLEGRGLVSGLHGRYRPIGSLLGDRVREAPR